MAYDLTLLHEGRGRSREASEQALQDLLRLVPGAAACEPRSAFVAPSDLDCDAVEELLEEDRVATKAFETFCKARGVGVSAARSTPEACAAFLDQQWGASLVTISLPPNLVDAEAVFAALVEHARKGWFTLWDPQTGKPVDLRTPGKLPSLF